jgi:hypothetical protein
MLPMSSGATRSTGPTRGSGVDPAALASDLDEPVVVGERAPRAGLARPAARGARWARAMLGKKGTPSLFKFGFKVVPREEAVASRLRAAPPRIRACAAQGWGLLELAACYVNQKLRASGRGPTGYKRVGDWWR